MTQEERERYRGLIEKELNEFHAIAGDPFKQVDNPQAYELLSNVLRSSFMAGALVTSNWFVFELPKLEEDDAMIAIDEIHDSIINLINNEHSTENSGDHQEEDDLFGRN